MLEKVSTRLQELLNNGQWRSFKLLLRFMACLQSLYNDEGVYGLLDELFNRAVDLQTASAEDVSTMSCYAVRPDTKQALVLSS
ncbi:hypothetical protein MRB53_037096 [Persea americana]|nr:hypothetical protein MRB53_037096 [Persea americana]